MYHCTEHGIDHREFDCPRCVAQRRHDEVIDALNAQGEVQAEAAEAETKAAEARAEALAEAERNRFNPGEYECPHCLYTTLRRHASRCPICQGTIDGGYWKIIIQAEEEASKRRKEEQERRLKEWERTKPEREREAARKKAEKEREAEREKIETQRKAVRKRVRVIVKILLTVCGYGIVLFAPVLSILATSVLVGPKMGPFASLDNPLKVPGFSHLGWWFVLIHYYGTPTGVCLFWSAVCWTVCGFGAIGCGTSMES